MFQQLALGSMLMVVTTIVYAGCTIAALVGLRMTRTHVWALRTRSGRMSLISALVLLMFLAAVLEVTIWAAVYLAVGAISALEQALYFSMVTFTTLGYGDVVLKEGWRILASFEGGTASSCSAGRPPSSSPSCITLPATWGRKRTPSPDLPAGVYRLPLIGHSHKFVGAKWKCRV